MSPILAYHWPALLEFKCEILHELMIGYVSYLWDDCLCLKKYWIFFILAHMNQIVENSMRIHWKNSNVKQSIKRTSIISKFSIVAHSVWLTQRHGINLFIFKSASDLTFELTCSYMSLNCQKLWLEIYISLQTFHICIP